MTISKEIQKFLQNDPFSLNEEEKVNSLLNICRLQIKFHLNNCRHYRIWYERNSFIKPEFIKELAEIPFVPSSVFKHLDLNSSKRNTKEIQSSGTTSQLKSKVFLDSETSMNQTKALSKILANIIGKKKRPFFIIDIEPKKIDIEDNMMSARFAGISGYLLAANKRHYLLTKDSSGNLVIDEKIFEKLINLSKDTPIVLIGYTYMVWDYLLKIEDLGSSFNFHKDTKLIHFGGWKKLKDRNIKKQDLLNTIEEKLSLNKNSVYDIYGFTEQLGTVYISKGMGGCRVSDYSHVIVRDPLTLEEVKDGESGFLQFISILPVSYPGFSILNDDIGSIVLRSNSKHEKQRLEFQVESRLEQSEARGCGDTLPENFFIS